MFSSSCNVPDHQGSSLRHRRRSNGGNQHSSSKASSSTDGNYSMQSKQHQQPKEQQLLSTKRVPGGATGTARLHCQQGQWQNGMLRKLNSTVCATWAKLDVPLADLHLSSLTAIAPAAVAAIVSKSGCAPSLMLARKQPKAATRKHTSHLSAGSKDIGVDATDQDRFDSGTSSGTSSSTMQRLASSVLQHANSPSWSLPKTDNRTIPPQKVMQGHSKRD